MSSVIMVRAQMVYVIRDDGTSPDGLCLVADDEIGKSMLLGPLKTLFSSTASFGISFV
jgi:hypothetical protein